MRKALTSHSSQAEFCVFHFWQVQQLLDLHRRYRGCTSWTKHWKLVLEVVKVHVTSEPECKSGFMLARLKPFCVLSVRWAWRELGVSS